MESFKNKEYRNQVIEKAMHSVRTLKNPDLKEFEDLFSPIVEAIGYRPLSKVKIDHIGIDHKDTLYIDFSYSCAGSIDSDGIAIPDSVLSAEDPILEAKINDAKQQLNYAISILNRAMLTVDGCEETVSEKEKTLQILLEKKGISPESEKKDNGSRAFIVDDEFGQISQPLRKSDG